MTIEKKPVFGGIAPASTKNEWPFSCAAAHASSRSP